MAKGRQSGAVCPRNSPNQVPDDRSATITFNAGDTTSQSKKIQHKHLKKKKPAKHTFFAKPPIVHCRLQRENAESRICVRLI